MDRLTRSQTNLLQLLSNALFQKQIRIDNCDWKEVYREANVHKVFPIIFSISQQYIKDEELLKTAKKLFRHSIAKTCELNFAHIELNRLLKENNIGFVLIKGLTTSLYYPNPELRISGDVDFFVKKEDFEKAQALLKNQHFHYYKESEKDVAYEKNQIRYEMHRGVRGTPKNQSGEAIFQKYFSDLVEDSVGCLFENQEIQVPSTFHHGLILLFHSIAHLTGQGIGLRQLCDWAVFEATIPNEEFIALFEKPLKECGIWRFACLMSLCANKYLGAPYRAWQGEAESALLEGIMTDIMNAGNFGEKDSDRLRQVKYIADMGDETVKRGSVIAQAKKSIEKKAAIEHKTKVAVLAEYAKKLLSGKRKPDTAKTLESAAERKAIYSEFHLFETEK